jgi:predicted secreted protein
MSIPFALALYFLIWWTMLFAVLPLARAKTQAEVGEVVPGTPEGAPSKLMMGRVVLINSIVAAVVFVAVVWGMNRFIPSISDVYPAGEALPKS